jgi:hypothetical protein
MVGQSVHLATEAHELASEAGEAIKASREMIKAALRGMGAASDISEVSHQGPASTSGETCNGEPDCCMGTEGPASSLGMVLAEHTGYDNVAPPPPRSWHRGQG